MTAEQFSDAVSTLTGIWNNRPDQKLINAHWAGHDFPIVRAALVPATTLQISLGRPNREQVVTVRNAVATTLEALELTNGDELTDRLSRGADAILARDPAPEARRVIQGLYLVGLGRKPRHSELALARPLLGRPVRKEGVEDLLWAIVMLPEFQLIY